MSSAYYQGVINRLNQDIEKYKKRIDQYFKYEAFLFQLVSKLSPIQTKMEKCESDFSKGGYTVGGKTLSEGDLTKKAELLAEAAEKLQAVAQKTAMKAHEFEEIVKSLKNQLEDAESAYKKALKEESKKK